MLGVRGAGCEHQAASALVKAVDWPVDKILRAAKAIKEGIFKGEAILLHAGSGGQGSGFVDDPEILILVEDIKGDVRRLGQGVFHLRHKDGQGLSGAD